MRPTERLWTRAEVPPKDHQDGSPTQHDPLDITAAAPPSVPVSAGEGGANPSSPGRSVRRRCFICDSANHLLAACPQRKKPASTAGGGHPSTSPSVLFVTRSEGSAKVNQQAVIVGTQVSVGLRDTAAEITLVRPGLVSPADFIPGRTLAVKGFGGVRPAVPMARVYLDWGAGRGLREVGVSENIPTDVLLGTDLGKLVSQYVLERDAGDLPRPTSGSTVGRAVCGDAQQDSWTGGQGMAVSQSAPAPGVPEVLCGSMRGQCDWEERQGVSECPPAPESAGYPDPMRGEAVVPMVEVGTRWRSAGSRAQGLSLPCDGVDQNAWEGWQDTVVCLPRPDSGVSVTPRGWEGEQGTKAGSFRAEPTGSVVLEGRCGHRNAWDEQDTAVSQPVSQVSETVRGAEGILGGQKERPRVAEGYPGPEPSRLAVPGERSGGQNILDGQDTVVCQSVSHVSEAAGGTERILCGQEEGPGVDACCPRGKPTRFPVPQETGTEQPPCRGGWHMAVCSSVTKQGVLDKLCDKVGKLCAMGGKVSVENLVPHLYGSPNSECAGTVRDGEAAGPGVAPVTSQPSAQS
uniref:Uncharacterized protein n=1 Tax=Leptobrachium leishanense TaxID=445787 RepID=A0A8C5M838_9ANUR